MALWRMGGSASRGGDGLFRRPQCQRPHRHSLHQRGARHPDRPSAAGFAFDLSHSYTVPILVSAAVNIIAAIIVAATPKTAAQAS
jgi:hypothetical protein